MIFKAMRNIINMGGLPAITVMLHSSHPRMLNEALVSLTVLSASLGGTSEDPALVHRHLHTDLIINGAKRCLNNPDLPKELKSNGATFILTLLKVQTEDFLQMLKDLNFDTECLSPDQMNNLPKECQDLAEKLR
jgi:hypothetical protein